MMCTRISMCKSKTLHGRHAYELETPDVEKTALKALLQVCKLFPETRRFIIAIQVR
jgi:hypothetical protein